MNIYRFKQNEKKVFFALHILIIIEAKLNAISYCS